MKALLGNFYNIAFEVLSFAAEAEVCFACEGTAAERIGGSGSKTLHTGAKLSVD